MDKMIYVEQGIEAEVKNFIENVYNRCILLQLMDDVEKTLVEVKTQLNKISNTKVSILLTFLQKEVTKLRKRRKYEIGKVEAIEMCSSIESILQLISEEGIEGIPKSEEFFKRVEPKVLNMIEKFN